MLVEDIGDMRGVEKSIVELLAIADDSARNP